WLPDLFAVLYHELLTEFAGNLMSEGIDQQVPHCKICAGDIVSLRAAIDSSEEASTPDEIFDYLESAEDENDYMRRSLNVALAIDAAFEPLRLGANTTWGGGLPSSFIRRVRSFYFVEGKGRLNKVTASDVLVVPAELPPLRAGKTDPGGRDPSGDNLDYLFACLRVVPAKIHGFSVRLANVASLADTFRLAAVEGKDRDSLRIAIAPLVEIRSDAQVDCFEYRGVPRLRILLSDHQ